MGRAHLEIMLAGVVFWLVGAHAVQAEPTRAALVIANSQYGNLPALARCAASAAIARDALRAQGYDVSERSNLGRGEFDTAIGQLARRTTSEPGSVAALYYCGYGVEFKDRPFLLPVSATLARDHDVLTQGILAKSIVDSLRRAPDSAGFIVLDVFPPVGAPLGRMGRVGGQIPASSFAVIAAGNDGPGEGPTAAALALRDEISASDLRLDRLVSAMRGRLAKDAAITVDAVEATGQAASAMVGRRPPPPAPPAAPPAPPAAPPASAVVAPAIVAPPPPPAPPEPSPSAAPARPRLVMPDEDHMTEPERRQVQTVLAAMGYYAGRIDATFGPETRAAIRRYQFEIKADLTGRLTAEQATRLVNSAR